MQLSLLHKNALVGGASAGIGRAAAIELAAFGANVTLLARYQNLAINQTKLSGMCGRLKCCLNYELDAYIDALEDFPDKADRIKTLAGMAILIKTDVFKRLMFYTYAEDRSKFYPMHVDQIWEALAMLKQGQIPGSLDDIQAMAPQAEDQPEEEEMDFENVDNVIQLPLEKRKKKKKKKKRSESVAAAVEKEPASTDKGRPHNSGGRPDNRHGRQDNRHSRPDNRPRPPQDRKPDQRPPQDRKPDQRPPQPPPAQDNDKKNNDRPPGGNDRPKGNWNKNKFKGKPPGKE